MLNRIAGHRPAEVLVADLPHVRVGLADGVDHVAQQHRVADQPLDELAVDDLERVHIERVHIERVHIERVHVEQVHVEQVHVEQVAHALDCVDGYCDQVGHGSLFGYPVLAPIQFQHGLLCR
jgi:hypothetical protein